MHSNPTAQPSAGRPRPVVAADGHGQRHPASDPTRFATHLRAVLHDQGRGQGTGLGLSRLRHRRQAAERTGWRRRAPTGHAFSISASPWSISQSMPAAGSSAPPGAIHGLRHRNNPAASRTSGQFRPGGSARARGAQATRCSKPATCRTPSKSRRPFRTDSPAPERHRHAGARGPDLASASSPNGPTSAYVHVWLRQPAPTAHGSLSAGAHDPSADRFHAGAPSANRPGLPGCHRL